MVLFGGLYTNEWIDLTDTWLLARLSVLVYDSPSGRLLAVGYDSVTSALQTWRWTGSNWALLAAQSTVTAPDAVAHDPATGQLVAVLDAAGTLSTWIWKGSSWVMRTTTTQLPAFRNVDLAFDPGLDQLVLLGHAFGDVAPQTWQWTGSDWHKMTYPVPPTAMDEHLVYNGAQGQLLMFVVLSGNGLAPWNQTWSLDLLTTTKLSAPPATVPVGGAVTLTAAVSTTRLVAGLGKVAFYDGATLIAGCAARPVLAGSAQCVITFAAGQHVVVARYTGAPGYQPNTSASLSVRAG